MSENNSPASPPLPISNDPTRVKHARRSYKRKAPRSYVPRTIAKTHNAVERGLLWLLPWDIYDYPGKIRGMSEVMRGWNYASIKHWRDDRRKAPLLALDMLIAALRSRLESGQLVLEALYREREEALNRPGRGGRRPHIIKAEREAAKARGMREGD